MVLINRRFIHFDTLDKPSILVIGDNPNSEIKAGKAMGITTVLMKRGEKDDTQSVADYTIQSFGELPTLLELLGG